MQLRSVTVTAPERLREELRGLPVQRLLERCSRLRRSTTATPDELAVRVVLRTLARRIEAATIEADELEREILARVQARAGGRATAAARGFAQAGAAEAAAAEAFARVLLDLSWVLKTQYHE